MTASRNGFSYSRYVRECIATRGVIGTVWHLLCGIFEVTRDYLPWRRRIRYGDVDFDWDCRVDTTWANLRLRSEERRVGKECRSRGWAYQCKKIMRRWE